MRGQWINDLYHNQPQMFWLLVGLFVVAFIIAAILRFSRKDEL